MKGDFTRDSDQPDQGYTGVLMQQGRVQLDADWNEQLKIQRRSERRVRAELVGREGAPYDAPGFEVTTSGGGLEIGAGVYYVDGIRCESAAPFAIDDQPFLPGADVTAGLPPGDYLLYLDVWERHVTTIQDPWLQEKALGGPDTTTRRQLVWQVRPVLLTAIEDVPLDPCDVALDAAALRALIEGDRGRMDAEAQPASAQIDPCVVPADAGYRGLENQLYRVEIHTGGPLSSATFKWSRDNGSVATPWTDHPNPSSSIIEVGDMGPDAERSFNAADLWVELSDDRDDLAGRAGALVQVIQGDEASRTLQLSGALPSWDPTHHPKVRRWDTPIAEMPLDPDANAPEHVAIEGGVKWIVIEDGIRIRFDPAGNYRPGDHWLVPARTIDGSVLWQPPGPQAPHGIPHHYAALRAATWDGSAWTLGEDYRSIFPSLTDLITMRYAGGDGQLLVADHQGPRANAPLPAPLRVRVTNGGLPVEGARVAFRNLDGAAGRLIDASDANNNSDDAVVVPTDADGYAAVTWTPQSLHQAADRTTQRVGATLLGVCEDVADVSVDQVIFTATAEVVLSYAGGDGQQGFFEEKQPLPAPLLARVSCGDHPVEGAWVEFKPRYDQDQLTASPGFNSRTFNNRFFVQTDKNGLASCQWIWGGGHALPNAASHERFTRVVDAWLMNPWIGTLAPARTHWRLEYTATAQLILQFVGGDGQHGRFDAVFEPSDNNDGPAGRRLPAPLQVRVTNGEHPVVGVEVVFQVFHPWRVAPPDPNAPGDTTGWLEDTQDATNRGQKISIVTGARGIASCWWYPGQLTDRFQRITQPDVRFARATLQGVHDEDHYIDFAAQQINADEVLYDDSGCEHLKGNETAQAAIDALCDNYGLYYAGGDGQDGAPSVALAHPLRVRVAAGGFLAAGRRVRFEVEPPRSLRTNAAAAGWLDDGPEGAVASRDLWATNNAAQSRRMVVETDAQGVASCVWAMGSQRVGRVDRSVQQVLATLLDASGQSTGQQVRFTGNVRGESTATPDTPKGVLITGLSTIEGVALDEGTAIPFEQFTGVQIAADPIEALGKLHYPRQIRLEIDSPFGGEGEPFNTNSPPSRVVIGYGVVVPDGAARTVNDRFVIELSANARSFIRALFQSSTREVTARLTMPPRFVDAEGFRFERYFLLVRP